MFPKAEMKTACASRCRGSAITIAMKAAGLQMQISPTGRQTLFAWTTKSLQVRVPIEQAALVNKAQAHRCS
jgi:hypothetical protein